MDGGNRYVEQIPKRDVLDSLHDATRKTKKGSYHKTKHAPTLLAAINPERVRAAAPNCDRLFESMTARLAG
ncbi:MAG: DUF4276 family protein [bacterium]|nr:DUF4276 family protein [bacterium]